MKENELKIEQIKGLIFNMLLNPLPSQTSEPDTLPGRNLAQWPI